MRKIQYSIGGKARYFEGPSEWKEMNSQQYLATIKILLSVESSSENVWAIPPILLNIPLKEYFQMNITQRTTLLVSFQHLREFKELPVKWLISKIKVGVRIWHGPNEKLSNLVFAEFMYAETMLERYYKKKDSWELDRFIAIFYRPNNFLGSRPKFDNKQVDERAKALKNLPFHVKTAILLNYQGWKYNLKRLFPYVFQEGSSEDTTQSSNWLEQAVRLAEHKQSEVDVIKNTNLYEILASFNLRLKDHEAYKKSLTKSQTT